LQTAYELLRILKTIVGILREHALQDGDELVGRVAAEISRVGHRRVEVRAQDFLVVVTAERKLATDELEERATQRVDARAEVTATTADLFGRGVVGELGRHGKSRVGRVRRLDADLAATADDDASRIEDGRAMIRRAGRLGVDHLRELARELDDLRRGEGTLRLQIVLERDSLRGTHDRLP